MPGTARRARGVCGRRGLAGRQGDLLREFPAPAITRIRGYVFTEARIDCKAWQHRLRRSVLYPARSLEASRWLDRYSTDHERGGRPMPPDHDHFSGHVIQVGLRGVPDRETG